MDFEQFTFQVMTHLAGIRAITDCDDLRDPRTGVLLFSGVYQTPVAHIFTYRVTTVKGEKREMLFAQDVMSHIVVVSSTLPLGDSVGQPWHTRFSFPGLSPLGLVGKICTEGFCVSAPRDAKTWTLREACEQNKTRQQCCVCGKPTVRMALCLTAVQYCRCVEQLAR